ncbi:hypothetical protein IFM89_020961 [Coptis chinensis]|uniref:Alpha/beta hydrolase fold-3 domain-containing protein n=1 Tax=Coptis chinensis TaxID=261450 RepID=A0A835ICY2_9MAGN|nr:hypothetical protein IFM89_020961 [Coptis chinensis]
MDLGPVKMAGLIINQPFFGGLEKTRLERRKPNDVMIPRSSMDLLWELALPVGSDQDHEYCNPFIKGSYHKNIGLLPRTLIRAFQGDPLMDRDIHFVKMLVKLGVQITGHFGEIGFHCADSFDATRNLTMIKYMKDFI